ncbi:hypothetical protein DQ04_10361000 [Trypanosoma grayi]|uniref:hypothetical protein n=1 Tax=Trypanosoma grayi TaxID=71804 RepID=UPI0004F3FAC9|nr:hypothetical protein DQ04_10361000 [Trypanosoma grayi]KEG07267.1 hypothetical protein DQ04_10361000 [Trypanosoma grayi]
MEGRESQLSDSFAIIEDADETVTSAPWVSVVDGADSVRLSNSSSCTTDTSVLSLSMPSMSRVMCARRPSTLPGGDMRSASNSSSETSDVLLARSGERAVVACMYVCIKQNNNDNKKDNP